MQDQEKAEVGLTLANALQSASTNIPVAVSVCFNVVSVCFNVVPGTLDHLGRWSASLKVLPMVIIEHHMEMKWLNGNIDSYLTFSMQYPPKITCNNSLTSRCAGVHRLKITPFNFPPSSLSLSIFHSLPLYFSSFSPPLFLSLPSHFQPPFPTSPLPSHRVSIS